MNPDRWQSVKRLFRRVVDQPTAERERLLEEACAGDGEVRAEVEAMVFADRHVAGLREPTADGGGRAAWDTSPRHPLLGALLGPYRLAEWIGEGGSSEVFLAVRDDGSFEQRVAVKVLRAESARGDAASRFVLERQILATLDHPYIARLLDGGSTSEGRPYLVAEYVQGLPIDRYCDHNRLSVETRLELFVRVCSAVAYAHRHLVVHRDIKPGNVLVTDAGEPKLLDFGIAKLLDVASFPVTVEATHTGARWLTPAYASPEQAAAGPITIASDEYSLGVVLYQLLTGRLPRPPARLDALGPAAYEEDPEPPSAAVRGEPGGGEGSAEARRLPAARLRRRLAGDLDHIVLRALRKEPERRYGSVDRLAEDLRRHLAGLPVTARGDSVTYRVRKWVGRHRLASAAAATFLAALLGFSGAMTLQARRIAEERDLAQRERDRSAQVAEFLKEIFEVADPSESLGETITAREILERGAEKLERELADQPEVQGSLLTTVGEVFVGLGLEERAEAALRTAVESRRRAPDDIEGLAQSLVTLARVRVLRGDPIEAEQLAAEAVELFRLAPGGDAVGETTGLRTLAAAARSRGDYEGAVSLYRRALDVGRQAFGEDHELVAGTYHDLGVVLADLGDYRGAEEHQRRALELERRLYSPRHPTLLTTLNSLATTLAELGDVTGAEETYREILTSAEEVYGPDHLHLATPLQNLATLRQQSGDFAAAEAAFRRVLEIRRHWQGEEHPDTVWSYHSLGLVLRDRGDPEAVPTLRHALRLQRKVQGERHPLVAYTLLALGQLYLDAGEPAAAEPLLREGHSIWGDVLPASDPRVAAAAGRLGAALMRQGRLAEAEPLLRESLAVLVGQTGWAGPEAERVEEWLRELETARGKPEPPAEAR